MNFASLPDLVIHKILEFTYGSRPLYFNWNQFWNWKERNFSVLNELESKYYPCYYLAANTNTKWYNDNKKITSYRVQLYSPSNINTIFSLGSYSTIMYHFIDKEIKKEIEASTLMWCNIKNKFITTKLLLHKS